MHRRSIRQLVLACTITGFFNVVVGCPEDPLSEAVGGAEPGVPEERSSERELSRASAAARPGVAAEVESLPRSTPKLDSRIGLRDPFRGGPGPDGPEPCPADRHRTVLELHEVRDHIVREVHLERTPTSPSAVVETPEGVRAEVHLGDALGERCGRVLVIAERGVVVLEERRDPESRELIFDEIELPLRLVARPTP